MPGLKGESGIKYSYNNGTVAADPELASLNFLNALEKIPKLIEKYELDSEKISRDITVLQEVVTGSWKKEEQLAELKSELTTLDRQIQLSLKPVEKTETQQEPKQDNTLNPPSEHSTLPANLHRTTDHFPINNRGMTL